MVVFAGTFARNRSLPRGVQVLQILKARPEEVSGAFLLFPSLCNMATTPNGRKLSVSVRKRLKLDNKLTLKPGFLPPANTFRRCSAFSSSANSSQLCVHSCIPQLAGCTDRRSARFATVTCCDICMLDVGRRRNEKDHEAR